MRLTMSAERVAEALAIPDLTDPRNGVHAVNIMLSRVIGAIEALTGYPRAETYHHSPVVPITDNYDRLYFPADNVSRSPVYTRYVSGTELLRTHTSCAIPDILAADWPTNDRLLVCPGICYRRDVVDCTHTGEPHQVDIWRVKQGEPRLERSDLLEYVAAVVNCVMPGAPYRCNEVEHPYTMRGLEVEISIKGEWLEIFECGEASPQLFADAGLNSSEYSGLASGIGLDRLVMVVKGIDDIRLLRAQRPQIKRQMTDLAPYVPISKMPAVRHDMSIAVDEAAQIEDLCDAMRDELGADSPIIEEVKILSETPFDALPPQAIERLGMVPGQKNVLVRVVLCSHERTLTQGEANSLRDRLYLVIHRGTKQMLTNSG